MVKGDKVQCSSSRNLSNDDLLFQLSSAQTLTSTVASCTADLCIRSIIFHFTLDRFIVNLVRGNFILQPGDTITSESVSIALLTIHPINMHFPVHSYTENSSTVY